MVLSNSKKNELIWLLPKIGGIEIINKLRSIGAFNSRDSMVLLCCLQWDYYQLERDRRAGLVGHQQWFLMTKEVNYNLILLILDISEHNIEY